MLATLAFTSASVLKAPLALRGGMTIAGVEPEQVATGLNALLAVQGLMMTQNQAKIHEVYGVKPTPITELFTENGGGILVGFAIAATLVLGGTDAAEAVGYGNIPNLLQNIKDFVGGTADKNGWGAPAKFVPLVVNAAFCAALLGKVDAVSTADALKAFAFWNLANAVGLYALPDKAMEGWGISNMAPIDVSFTKLFGTLLGTMGAFAYQLSDGKSAVESLGAAWAVNTAGLGASTFITNDGVGDPDKAKFWVGVGAVGAAAMLL